VIGHQAIYKDHLERIQYASQDYHPFKYVVQNRAGIITVKDSNPDVIYGGGIYDGHFNVDIASAQNGIDRAYAVATMHRNPRKVLEIGLSSGSWARVLLDSEQLESLSIVEINKAYPQVIENYPDIAKVLTHPKAKLYFDDGRRWLRNHPDEKFDVIVMNTTFYWRSNSTNLLSKEFIEQCKTHLKPNGVIYYNTTGSSDVVLTATKVFKHVTKYFQFVAASDAEFNMSPEEKMTNLHAFKDTLGQSVFDKSPATRKVRDFMVNYQFQDLNEKFQQDKTLQVITDDNMAVEFKVGVH